MRYAFMNLVQEDLDRVKREWNSHGIRRSRNDSVPHGIPDILYGVPEMRGIVFIYTCKASEVACMCPYY